MRRKRPSLKTNDVNRIRRRRGDTDLPTVPVYRIDSLPATTPPTETEDDPTEEAVRRMIEAAYT